MVFPLKAEITVFANNFLALWQSSSVIPTMISQVLKNSKQIVCNYATENIMVYMGAEIMAQKEVLTLATSVLRECCVRAGHRKKRGVWHFTGHMAACFLG